MCSDCAARGGGGVTERWTDAGSERAWGGPGGVGHAHCGLQAEAGVLRRYGPETGVAERVRENLRLSSDKGGEQDASE